MLLEFDKVSFSYDGKQEVLKEISFSVEEGERVALLGLNGSGKSTLMLHTNGLLLPTSGKVTVNGNDTGSKKLSEVRQTVGLVFQNPDDQLFMPTVWEDVAFGPRNMNLTEREVAERVDKALEATGTTELSHRSPFQLSGGQKKSVSVATVLSMTPSLLVMDEPTSGLDISAVENFINIMESLPQAYILSTHDMSLAKRLCTRILFLEKGSLAFDGPVESFL